MHSQQTTLATGLFHSVKGTHWQRMLTSETDDFYHMQTINPLHLLFNPLLTGLDF